MIHKIQPQQLNLGFFSSPSGDILFQSGESYIYANLSRNLTGDFNITGSLRINNNSILTPDPSNFSSGTRLWVLGGQNNSIYQSGNFAVNSNDSLIYGSGNLDLNGIGSSFETGTKSNTILAGKNCTIPANTTGSVLLKDQTSSSLSSFSSNSFSSSFTGGYRILGGNVYIENELTLGQNFNVSSTKSGVFSGDAHVLGNLYFGTGLVAKKYNLDVLSGTVVTNKTAQDSLSGSLSILSGQFTGVSGRLDALSGYTTGSVAILSGNVNTVSGLYTGLSSQFSTLSGQFTGVSGSAVYQTGNQALTGIKTFNSPASFQSGINFGITGGPAFNAVGATGMFFCSGVFLYAYNGTGYTRFSGVDFY